MLYSWRIFVAETDLISLDSAKAINALWMVKYDVTASVIGGRRINDGAILSKKNCRTELVWVFHCSLVHWQYRTSTPHFSLDIYWI